MDQAQKTRYAIHVQVFTAEGRKNVGQTVSTFVQRLKKLSNQFEAEVLENCSHFTGGRYDADIYVAVSDPNAIWPLIIQANSDGMLKTETVPALTLSNLSQLDTWSRTGAHQESTRTR